MRRDSKNVEKEVDKIFRKRERNLELLGVSSRIPKLGSIEELQAMVKRAYPEAKQ